MHSTQDLVDSSKITKIILESRVPVRQYLSDLWHFREVFLLIAIRDILMRYRQAMLGIGWALLRPLVVIVFFVIVFGHVHSQQVPVPYYLFVLSAAPAWIFFSSSVDNSTSSVVKNANLITKVYFPKLILVAATVTTNLVDFLVAMSLALGCAIFEDTLHFYNLLFLPLVLLSLFLCVFAWSIFVAAINVRFRDVVNIVPFLLQLMIIISPIGYSTPNHNSFLSLFFYLNPLTGIIGGMRYALLNYYSPDIFWALFFSTAQSLVVLYFSFAYFRKIEDAFADVL